MTLEQEAIYESITDQGAAAAAGSKLDFEKSSETEAATAPEEKRLQITNLSLVEPAAQKESEDKQDEDNEGMIQC